MAGDKIRLACFMCTFRCLGVLSYVFRTVWVCWVLYSELFSVSVKWLAMKTVSKKHLNCGEKCYRRKHSVLLFVSQIFYDLVRQINRKNPDALGRGKKTKKSNCSILWQWFVSSFILLLVDNFNMDLMFIFR